MQKRDNSQPLKVPKDKLLLDPGKGNRTPKMWGQWLLGKLGLQRQMLQMFQTKRTYQGMWDEGTPRGDHQRKVLAKRRAKNKMAARSRRINRKVAKR